MTTASALYRGTVVHRRHKPAPHRLAYSVFMLLLDLDELPALARRSRLFAHNRFAPLAFYDRDHGDGSGAPLRPQIEARLAAAGIDIAGGPIRVLCLPRVLGYVFNPLSVFYCYRPDGSLAAVLYEVSNTFGERHGYLLPATAGSDGLIRQACPKRFHVSPFIGMEAHYAFRLLPPGERVAVAIHETDAEGPLLDASFTGRRAPLTERTLASVLLRFPLLTLKVIAAIHWEALKLWRKGVPLHPRPPAAVAPTTTTITPAE